MTAAETSFAAAERGLAASLGGASSMPSDAFGAEATRKSLVDVLDRLLDRGVVVAGDLTISVADVDLIFLGLKLFIASTDTMEDARETQRERWRDALDQLSPTLGAPHTTRKESA